MMYSFSITIPANTPESAPTIQDIVLDVGIIHHVEIAFPDGCDGLVHAIIRKAIHHLWPSNTDEDISGNGALISFDEDYHLDETPYTLTVEAWNEDTAYPHTIEVRLAMRALPPIVSETTDILGLTLDDILGLVGV